EADVDVERAPVADLGRLEAGVLVDLLGPRADLDPGVGGGGHESVERLGGHLRPPVGDHRCGADHGSTSRAAAAIPASSSAPTRPGSASHTNVSRLPLGPGRPELAKPSTETPSPVADAATDSSAERRSAGSRTTPPLPTFSRPTSNCGLIIARQSWTGS